MPTWLTLEELRRRGGSYTGTVAEVRVGRHRNKFRFENRKAVYEEQPVVVFADGAMWIPNRSALRALVARFGHESDRWVGERLEVFVHAVEHTDKETGEVRTRHERAVRAAEDERGTAPREVADSPAALSETTKPKLAIVKDAATAQTTETPKPALMTADEIPWGIR